MYVQRLGRLLNIPDGRSNQLSASEACELYDVLVSIVVAAKIAAVRCSLPNTSSGGGAAILPDNEDLGEVAIVLGEMMVDLEKVQLAGKTGMDAAKPAINRALRSWTGGNRTGNFRDMLKRIAQRELAAALRARFPLSAERVLPRTSNSSARPADPAPSNQILYPHPRAVLRVQNLNLLHPERVRFSLLPDPDCELLRLDDYGWPWESLLPGRSFRPLDLAALTEFTQTGKSHIPRYALRRGGGGRGDGGGGTEGFGAVEGVHRQAVCVRSGPLALSEEEPPEALSQNQQEHDSTQAQEMIALGSSVSKEKNRMILFQEASHGLSPDDVGAQHLARMVSAPEPKKSLFPHRAASSKHFAHEYNSHLFLYQKTYDPSIHERRVFGESLTFDLPLGQMGFFSGGCLFSKAGPRSQLQSRTTSRQQHWS